MKFKVEYISQSVPYADACQMQEDKVAEVLAGAPETLFLAEHAPVYTCGSSFEKADLLDVKNIPVVKTGRGGKVTYHGPGQRVLYPIINLNHREKDLRLYIQTLQKWVILTLAELGVEAFSDDEVGVWVQPKGAPAPAKIAAIGVRVRKWVTFHGVALNVAPNMRHFKGIVPCGIRGKGVTSLQELGITASMEKVDKILLKKFTEVFYSSSPNNKSS